MRRDYFLGALFSLIVPVLTTAACPCWDEIIQDVHSLPEASKLVEGRLCDDPSLLVKRFEQCIDRERCAFVDVRDPDQERWFREICNVDRNNIDLRQVELRRRDDNQDPPSDSPPPDITIVTITPSDSPTPSDAPTPPSDTPAPPPKKGSSAKAATTTSHSAKHTTKASTTTDASSTTTDSSSSDSSTSSTTTAESSSTSITTSTSTTSEPSSSPTAPAASATLTSSSGPNMGPGSIAAATIFSTFAAGCIGFLIFVCFRRIRRDRQSRKKESMDEQLLGGAAKPGSGGSHRSASGSSRSIHDTESMFGDRNGSVANIPLADRQSGYPQRLYPLGNNAYHQAPQYEPRDAYGPNGDSGDLGRQPSPYSNYSPPYSAPHSPAPEQFHSYRSPSATYTDQNQAWAAAPIAPIRNMRSGSMSSTHLNLPMALTSGEPPAAHGAPGYAVGGYPSQNPSRPSSRSRLGP
ncbi:hypothetical protein FGG08_005581 [Glutinoglossum americanum]|uniref:Uncharacterized protein n=1 Tax=Glutinoglossum americanum TaxID=1670608 RepID=A0A9P8L2R6_9PEZI|nr:hypothetical protein FGG08_005581 [Glutinoglossum americanum]